MLRIAFGEDNSRTLPWPPTIQAFQGVRAIGRVKTTVEFLGISSLRAEMTTKGWADHSEVVTAHSVLGWIALSLFFIVLFSLRRLANYGVITRESPIRTRVQQYYSSVEGEQNEIFYRRMAGRWGQMV
ncbi:hypothetical protein WAI453_001576 [Rhynchosporium graminicola]